MATSLTTLTPELKDDLRRRFSSTDDLRWVEELAARRGWEEANRSYLESMRERGFQEMSAVMEAAGVGGAVSREDAFQLVEAVLAVYLPEARATRTVDDAGDPVLAIEVQECPTFARIEQSGWHGVTACGSWHRRQGWYQALGMSVVDTVVGEKKWGDVACATLVKIPEAASEQDRVRR